MAVYARSEPRFLRAHVQPVRRRSFARRVVLFVHLGLALVVAGGFTWSFGWLRDADVLRVDTITVEGNQRLSSGEVAGLMEPLRGANLLVAGSAVYNPNETPQEALAALRAALGETSA